MKGFSNQRKCAHRVQQDAFKHGAKPVQIDGTNKMFTRTQHGFSSAPLHIAANTEEAVHHSVHAEADHPTHPENFHVLFTPQHLLKPHGVFFLETLTHLSEKWLEMSTPESDTFLVFMEEQRSGSWGRLNRRERV